MATDDLGNVVEDFLTQAKRLRQYEALTSDFPEFQEEQREVLAKRVEILRAAYGVQLVGTPEHAYLDALSQHYSNDRNTALNPTLDLPLESLDFSVRSSNVFKSEGIIYVGELVRKKPEELIKLKYFGSVSLKETTTKLKGLDLELGMDIVYVPPEKRT